MLVSPCKECQRRVLGCHSCCEDYKKFAELSAKNRKRNFGETDYVAYKSDVIIKNKKRRHIKK